MGRLINIAKNLYPRLAVALIILLVVSQAVRLFIGSK
jgi:hypothetical protein